MPTTDDAADITPLLRFLNESPTPFHAVANIAARLRAAGYAEMRRRANIFSSATAR